LSRLGVSTLAILIAVSVTACSGSGNGTGSSQPTPLVWEACTQANYPTISQTVVDYFGSRMQCTRMTAPIDYRHPSHGHIEIALSKVAAAKPEEKIGSLFMNPGGPGGSGLSIAPFIAQLLDQTKTDTGLGKKLHQIPDQYDFIGFDPRGVGSSSTLTCKIDQFYKPEWVASIDRSEANFDNIYLNQQFDAQACQANSLTPFINSDATARDMDRARQLLGLKTLDYYGYSYGTWLGVWYASMFPNRVNHIVLDSTVDFTHPLVENNQSMPLQFVFDYIVIPYAALHPELFNLGTSAAEIRNLYFTLNLQLQTALSNQLYFNLFFQDRANMAVENVSSAKVIEKIVEEDPDITEEELNAILSTYMFSDDPTINTQTQQVSLQLAKAYMKLVKGIPVPVVLQNDGGASDAVNKSVSCNDTDAPTEQTYWDQLVLSNYPSIPAYLHDRLELNCTSDWGGATVIKPAPANARAIGNILMVQDQYDPATPLPGALNTFTALGNASLIYNSISYTHAVFPSGESCIDSAVADYLLNPVTSEHTNVSCEGTGLPGVIPAAPAAGGAPQLSEASGRLAAILKGAKVKPNSDYVNEVFSNPDQARALIEEIRSQIGAH
jgi:pimeloyl-ACP methyl ester carboxylesterase